MKVDVHAEDSRSDERRLATSSFFTFVAVDKDGKPTEVPDLECQTATEEALLQEAVEDRRTQLQDINDRLEATD